MTKTTYKLVISEPELTPNPNSKVCCNKIHPWSYNGFSGKKWLISNKHIIPAQSNITDAWAKWAPKNLPLKSINLIFPDHHAYLEPIIQRLNKDDEITIRILK